MRKLRQREVGDCDSGHTLVGVKDWDRDPSLRV